MPYRISHDGRKFVVVKADSGEPVPGGEHPRKSKALAHLQALEANVEDAAPAGMAKAAAPAGGQAKIFIPLFKVDQKRHQVWGYSAVEEPDVAEEIMDYESSLPHFQKWSSSARERSGGKSLGNLRSMHQNIASGRLIDFRPDNGKKGIWIGAEVVDPGEWDKVEKGVYTGFSIGGDYVSRWYDARLNKTRYTAKPIEISLVDAPCIPSATFQVVKADGSQELRKFVSGPGGEHLLKAEMPGSPSPAGEQDLGPIYWSEITVDKMPDQDLAMQVKPEQEIDGATLASRHRGVMELTTQIDELLQASGAGEHLRKAIGDYLSEELQKAGAWEESKHPRAANGEFGSGSGGGSHASDQPQKHPGGNAPEGEGWTSTTVTPTYAHHKKTHPTTGKSARVEYIEPSKPSDNPWKGTKWDRDFWEGAPEKFPYTVHIRNKPDSIEGRSASFKTHKEAFDYANKHLASAEKIEESGDLQKAGSWEESKHKRDESGEFSAGGAAAAGAKPAKQNLGGLGVGKEKDVPRTNVSGGKAPGSQPTPNRLGAGEFGAKFGEHEGRAAAAMSAEPGEQAAVPHGTALGESGGENFQLGSHPSKEDAERVANQHLAGTLGKPGAGAAPSGSYSKKPESETPEHKQPIGEGWEHMPGDVQSKGSGGNAVEEKRRAWVNAPEQPGGEYHTQTYDAETNKTERKAHPTREAAYAHAEQHLAGANAHMQTPPAASAGKPAGSPASQPAAGKPGGAAAKPAGKSPLLTPEQAKADREEMNAADTPAKKAYWASGTRGLLRGREEDDPSLTPEEHGIMEQHHLKRGDTDAAWGHAIESAAKTAGHKLPDVMYTASHEHYQKTGQALPPAENGVHTMNSSRIRGTGGTVSYHPQSGRWGAAYPSNHPITGQKQWTAETGTATAKSAGDASHESNQVNFRNQSAAQEYIQNHVSGAGPETKKTVGKVAIRRSLPPLAKRGARPLEATRRLIKVISSAAGGPPPGEPRKIPVRAKEE